MSTSQIDNIKTFQILLHELMVKKQLERKVVLFIDLSPRLPSDISDIEIERATNDLVEKKYIIFEPGPGVRTRFVPGPLFELWSNELEKYLSLMGEESAMTELDILNQKRFDFMKRLYEKTNANTIHEANMNEIGKELKLNDGEIDTVTNYLEGEGLLEYSSMGGGVSITHYGIKEVEQALSAPQAPTEHFPPMVNITTIGTMQNSSLQQGTIASSQVITTTVQQSEDFEKLLNEIKIEISKLNLNDQDKNDIELQIGTLDNQCKSSRKNSAVINGTIDTMKTILKGAAGSGLWQLLAQLASLI
jgi:DNA-binding MarR family transcriptional regulator